MLRATCAAGCHQAGGSTGPTPPRAPSFRGNRFVLTGSAEGDYNVTLSMISEHLQAGVELPAQPSVDRAASGRRGRRRPRPSLPVGSAGYNSDRELDRGRLRSMTADERTTRATRRSVPLAADSSLLALPRARGVRGRRRNPLDNPPDVEQPRRSQAARSCRSPTSSAACTRSSWPAADPPGIDHSINTCAGSGCHDNANGTGGAFRVVRQRAAGRLTNPANTADVIRASDMYKNFYSAQGEVVFGSPRRAALLAKPLVHGVLHGGGLIFDNAHDPNAQADRSTGSATRRRTGAGRVQHAATYGMFTPADPNTGTCNTQ